MQRIDWCNVAGNSIQLLIICLICIFSLPGGSPGRAIVLHPALGLASALASVAALALAVAAALAKC